MCVRACVCPLLSLAAFLHTRFFCRAQTVDKLEDFVEICIIRLLFMLCLKSRTPTFHDAVGVAFALRACVYDVAFALVQTTGREHAHTLHGTFTLAQTFGARTHARTRCLASSALGAEGRSACSALRGHVRTVRSVFGACLTESTSTLTSPAARDGLREEARARERHAQSGWAARRAARVATTTRTHAAVCGRLRTCVRAHVPKGAGGCPGDPRSARSRR